MKATQARSMRVFLCGDVMTGRGIDQALPHPVRPTLYEPCVRDARDYVRLAESANGPVPRPVPFEYVWGDALGELERAAIGVDRSSVRMYSGRAYTAWRNSRTSPKFRRAWMPPAVAQAPIVTR